MRNAYILINYGDFVDGSTSKQAPPYIQLLPLTTDRAAAHADFVTIRQGGVDRTGDFKLLPASVLPNTTSSPSSDDDSSDGGIHQYIPYIIIGCSVAGLMVLVALGVCFAKRRRARYRRLQEPAPAGVGAMDQPFMQYRPERRY